MADSSSWLKLGVRILWDDRWLQIKDVDSQRAKAQLLFIGLICYAKSESGRGELTRDEVEPKFLCEQVMRYSLTESECQRAVGQLYRVGALVRDPSGLFACLIARYERWQQSNRWSESVWEARRREAEARARARPE